ncbi:MAG: hypothetical protein HY077_07515 [Elusimicrobia bacterium]|nr:hypothetical protein [Elusimicrobiota bacterium]
MPYMRARPALEPPVLAGWALRAVAAARVAGRVCDAPTLCAFETLGAAAVWVCEFAADAGLCAFTGADPVAAADVPGPRKR